MGMSVDNHIDSRRIGHHASGAPALGHSVHTKMGYQNHIISAFRPGCIHTCLNLAVKRLSRGILGETVNIPALSILEVCRCGLGKAFRCGHSYVGYLNIIIIDDFIRLKYGRIGRNIDKVAGIIAAVQLTIKA